MYSQIKKRQQNYYTWQLQKDDITKYSTHPQDISFYRWDLTEDAFSSLLQKLRTNRRLQDMDFTRENILNFIHKDLGLENVKEGSLVYFNVRRLMAVYARK